MGEGRSKRELEQSRTGVVRDKGGPEGQENELKSSPSRGQRVWASLGRARDHAWEGTKESFGVMLAEMHSSEIWTLKRPHPAARQDLQW